MWILVKQVQNSFWIPCSEFRKSLKIVQKYLWVVIYMCKILIESIFCKNKWEHYMIIILGENLFLVSRGQSSRVVKQGIL